MKFDERVWILMKKIPSGKITTYKILAEKLGTKAYRAVGQACKRNLNAPIIPCHRVVLSTGRIGNYSSAGGVKKKIVLLKKEGIKIKNNRIENFEKILFKF